MCEKTRLQASRFILTQARVRLDCIEILDLKVAEHFEKLVQAATVVLGQFATVQRRHVPVTKRR